MHFGRESRLVSIMSGARRWLIETYLFRFFIDLCQICFSSFFFVLRRVLRTPPLPSLKQSALSCEMLSLWTYLLLAGCLLLKSEVLLTPTLRQVPATQRNEAQLSGSGIVQTEPFVCLLLSIYTLVFSRKLFGKMHFSIDRVIGSINTHLSHSVFSQNIFLVTRLTTNTILLRKGNTVLLYELQS